MEPRGSHGTGRQPCYADPSDHPVNHGTENRELGAPRWVERMVELVLRGLQWVYAPALQQPTPEA